MIIGPGITVGTGITISDPAASFGSTASTATPTSNGTASIGTTHGSPFATSVNSYILPTTSSVSPYSYYSTPGVAGFNFGTGDFTIEWFQYQTDSNSFPRVFWYSNGTSAVYWGVSIEGGTFYFWNASFNA